MVLITGWTKAHTERFQKDIFKANHRLSETELFSDEALAALLDMHPKTHLDVCTMGNDPLYPDKFRTGDVRGVDGKTLITAAKAGSIWINMRKAMNLHPEYRDVLDQIYAEIGAQTKQKPYSANGGILISSPTARVPYHFDATETILWHVRGHKRLYLYPRTERFLPDEGYERVMFCDNEDYLPYTDNMDKNAAVFDLYDDEFLTWPLNSPHRVENLTYCVSVTTEYSTFESTMKNSVMYTNAVLREKWGMNPSWRGAGSIEKASKAFAGKLMRKMGVLRSLRQTDIVTFKVDSHTPGYILDTAPYLRNF